MKRPGSSKEPSALKEKLLRSIQFLEAQVKAVGKIQQNFVIFTERSLKEILTESEKYAGSPRISILWHDFVFIFFQYFIAIYDEFMALCTGDLMAKRLRQEHREYQHHRVNSVQASTNATTYAGSWFTMACFDGINLEARRAEKMLKRREYEALELQLLHVETMSDTLERDKSLFLATLKQVAASMREVRGDSVALFSKVDYSKGHMCENMTFTLNSTGEVHFYSRRTMADTNITSKLSGHHPLRVVVDKSRLLADPFAPPAWFPMSLYTRQVAKQKRTIQDDDDEESDGENLSPDAKKGKGVVIKKRSLAEVQRDIAGDDATIATMANSENGGVSLDAIKKQYNANSALLAEEETSGRIGSYPSHPSLISTNSNSSHIVKPSCSSAGAGGRVVSDLSSGQSAKRGRLGLPVHPGESVRASNMSVGAGRVPSSYSAASHLTGNAHNDQEVSVIDMVDSSASAATLSLHAAWLKVNEDGDDDSSDIMLNKLTQDVSIDGVVVVFEEVPGEERPSDDGASTTEGGSACNLCSVLVPRACAIRINLSWVDMCNIVTGANNGVMISSRNLLKHALRQLWCARLEKSDKSESFYQLPITVNLEIPSSNGTEKTTQVYHDGELIPLASLMQNSFSIWCASEMSFVSVLKQFGQHWSSSRLAERAARGGAGNSVPLYRQRRCPRPSFSLLSELRNYYVSTVNPSSMAAGTSKVNVIQRSDVTVPPVHFMLNNLVISYKELFFYVDIILEAVKALSGKSPCIHLRNIQFPIAEEAEETSYNQNDNYEGSSIILSLLNQCESLHISNCLFPDMLRLCAETIQLICSTGNCVDERKAGTVGANVGVEIQRMTTHDVHEREGDADGMVDARHSGDSSAMRPQPSLSSDMHNGNILRRPLSELVISYVDLTNKSSSGASSSVSLLLSMLLTNALDMEKGNCDLKIELRRCVPTSCHWVWPRGQTSVPTDHLRALKQEVLAECGRLLGESVQVQAQKSVNMSELSQGRKSEDELVQVCCSSLTIR